MTAKIFKDIDEWEFTPEELEYFEQEMRKYKVPLLYKLVFGSLYKWGKYFMPLFFLVILILGIIHVSTKIDLWNILKIFSFIFIFGIGSLVLISFIWHKLKVLKECKRLGLTLYQWNTFATMWEIKYI